MSALATWLAACLVRAGGPRRDGGRLAVEQVVALDPKRRLTLVRCDGRRLLLLTGGSQDVSLGWLPTEADRPG